MVCKVGVKPFRPYLLSPIFSETGAKLKAAILAKLINGERASMHCKYFSLNLKRTIKSNLDSWASLFVSEKK